MQQEGKHQRGTQMLLKLTACYGDTVLWHVRIFKTADLLSRPRRLHCGFGKPHQLSWHSGGSKVGSKDRQALLMRNLINCLERDPDLSLVPTQDLPGIIPALYACTVCDYTSFLSGQGNCSFSNVFRYWDFIYEPRVKGYRNVLS